MIKAIVMTVPIGADGVAKVSIEYLLPCGTVTLPHASAAGIVAALQEGGADVLDLRESPLDASRIP